MLGLNVSIYTLEMNTEELFKQEVPSSKSYLRAAGGKKSNLI